MKKSRNTFWTAIIVAIAGLVSIDVVAQKLPKPTRLWSVGPITRGEPVAGISFGPNGATMTAPHVDSQTRSIYSSLRSVVFAGDRIVLASKIGTRKVEGAQVPAEVYSVLSLDTHTGAIKDTREFIAFSSPAVFATNDGHLILAGRKVMRLTSDLKDAGSFDYESTGHKYGHVENISPDGSTLGNATSPGFEMLDANTFQVTRLTDEGTVATSVNNKGLVTDNIHWIGDYPKDLGFITYIDAAGKHLVYHGACGGRPQFLTNDRILEPGCKDALIFDTQGKLLSTIKINGRFSFAGVSQNGKRFALQLVKFDGDSLKEERFVIYSVETGETITEVKPDRLPDEQSWAAFSPDGTTFVVGSPLKLTLYRLP
jgi:hypothetical protein